MYGVTHRSACGCFDLAFTMARWGLRHSTMTLWAKVNTISEGTRQC